VLGFGGSDTIRTGLCDGSRRLLSAPDDRDDDPPQQVAPHRGCAGCAGGGDAGLALGLVALVALFRRRAA
jgi:MYXO-CTERM domain-containing protein